MPSGLDLLGACRLKEGISFNAFGSEGYVRDTELVPLALVMNVTSDGNDDFLAVVCAEVEVIGSVVTAGVLDALPNLGFCPDILHCNDWHTAMIPMLAKTVYGGMQGSLRFLLTIHNIAYQGKFGFDYVQDLLGIDSKYYTPEFMELQGCANFLKAGCVFASFFAAGFGDALCTDFGFSVVIYSSTDGFSVKMHGGQSRR